MQFKAIEPGIDVSGESLGAILDGFKKYPTIAMKYMVKFGLVKNQGSKAPTIDRAAWYPQEAWLSAYEGIAKEVGVNSLFNIGKGVPEHAVFPPHVNDIHSGLASMDVAYHMNHRKNGKVMFNPQTGEMLEGIGHYACKPVSNENRIVCVCDDPYGCDFDRGIVTAMAARFEAGAKVAHDDDAPCRKKGAGACTYVVWW